MTQKYPNIFKHIEGLLLLCLCFSMLSRSIDVGRLQHPRTWRFHCILTGTLMGILRTGSKESANLWMILKISWDGNQVNGWWVNQVYNLNSQSFYIVLDGSIDGNQPMNDMRFPEELVAIHSEMSCKFIRNGTVMINYQKLGYNIFGHIHFIPFWDYVNLELRTLPYAKQLPDLSLLFGII